MNDGFIVGSKVTYIPKNEHGIIKEIPSFTNSQVRVVFHCADEWDKYRDYTAQLTNKSDLQIGWL